MKFSAKDDVDVPIEAVFELLSDFDMFERMAMRRGVDVVRRGDPSHSGLGSAWEMQFDWRGKDINMNLDIVTYERPEEIGLEATTQGIDANLQIELVALSKKRTRLHMNADVSAKTLPARLLVQSMKLARTNIDKRLSERLHTQCRNLEDRYRMAG
jgi:carbon monoxide dehydrogenase subunit G